MIGLIAAMPEESQALLQRTPGWTACRLGGFRAFHLRLSAEDCLLVESGVGLQRAGEAARMLLAENPRMVLSFGVAGQFSPICGLGMWSRSSKPAFWNRVKPVRWCASPLCTAKPAGRQHRRCRHMGLAWWTVPRSPQEANKPFTRVPPGWKTRCWKWKPPRSLPQPPRRASLYWPCAGSATIRSRRCRSTRRQCWTMRTASKSETSRGSAAPPADPASIGPPAAQYPAGRGQHGPGGDSGAQCPMS